MTSDRPLQHRFLAGLVPLLLALGALPLLAPTCGGGGEGYKVFARKSLIIPMDACHQSQRDWHISDGEQVWNDPYPATGCPADQDPGSVLKAYGLVYQLVRNNIAVYWIIKEGKASLTEPDLEIQYNGGFPALMFNWDPNHPGEGGGVNADPNRIVRYRGGPFVVDGSDYDRAIAVLLNYRTTFGPDSGAPVNVHISNVAFKGYAKKTMAGGWYTEDRTVPPKLALLDIGSGQITAVGSDGRPTKMGYAKNAEPVISGYLVEAGIGSGEMGGDADPARGPHGMIYDRLQLEDFLPSVAGHPETSRLFTNQYEILWIPHWSAPGSCRNYSSSNNCLGSLYTNTEISQVLTTIGAFVAAGKDVFAECAGLGSLEGAYKWGSTTAYDPAYASGNDATRFQMTASTRINEGGSNSLAFSIPSLGSPMLQLGDYPFTPVGGAIKSYRPQDNTSYQSNPSVVRLISSSTWDYFTVRDRVASGHGTIAYLAGHSYSGGEGGSSYPLQIGGTRLVLNTLFNLGAACSSSGVACQTGLLGICAVGEMRCGTNGMPTCIQTVSPQEECPAGASDARCCDGLDNDCDGLVDEVDRDCYEGDPLTKGVGLCTGGIKSCQANHTMSACTGQVLPSPEICNGLDDDCDGTADEALQRDCYTGPSTSVSDGVPMGICQMGRQTCTSGSWGACSVCPAICSTTCLTTPTAAGCNACVNCQILPQAETCTTSGNAFDENCDGQIDEGSACGGCTPVGATRQGCYTGPPATLHGICQAGHQVCQQNGTWSTQCYDQVTPSLEECSPASCATNPSGPNCNRDEDCDGQVDEDCGCQVGDQQDCYTGPEDAVLRASGNTSICQRGKQSCVSGEFAGACLGEIQPAPETCDGQDNDCDGVTDDGAACANGFYCTNGVCVPDHCGVESGCPEGYACHDDAADCAATDSCECPEGKTTCCVQVPSGCSGQTCAPGAKCDYGECKQLCGDPADPNYESICWPGAYCQSGGCVGGSCYQTGCKDADGNDTGELCIEGQCRPDPCADVVCPGGTFCRQGDCVQACTFVTCTGSEICSEDGFCEPDPCAGVLCDTGLVCLGGQCQEDPCAGKGCGAGQVCRDQVCIDDPCNGVVCPAGACLGGQCYAVGNPNPGVYDPPKNTSSGSKGCGCGQGSTDPLSALLLLAFLLPLARRRQRRRGGALVVLLSAALLASACGKGGGSSTFEPGTCRDGWTACEGESECVDVYTDPAHCGGCGAACAAGEVCRDRVCGPGSYVAPYITGIAPPSGDQGRLDPLTVTLSGDRFVEGATVRTVTSSGTSTEVPRYENGALKFDLDLSNSGPSQIYLRVVNPDRVISNSVAFDVVTPTPAITSVDPNPVLAGASRVLHVCGTGFLSSTRCHFGGPAIANELRLDTSAIDPCADPLTAAGNDCNGTSWRTPCQAGSSPLWCTLNATSLLPSTGYELWVVNQADPTPLESTPRTPITVSTQTPTLTELSPNQAASGQPVDITFGGSNFDATSRVLWWSSATGVETVIEPQLVDSTQLFKYQHIATADAKVRVRNGNGVDIPYTYSHATSALGLDFRIEVGLQVIASFSPPRGYQGQNIVFTFVGTGLTGNPAGTRAARVQVKPPNSTTWSAAFGSGNATQVTGSKAFTSTDPVGVWTARLCYPIASTDPCPAGTPSSAAYQFTLLSNQAILLSASPRSAPQGASPATSVTLSVANLQGVLGTMAVQLVGGTTAPTVTAVNTTSTPNTVTATVPTSGLATGTYSLRVVNPGAAPSNPLSFNVTPGLPTLSSPVTPSSLKICDPADPVLGTVVTLTGTNFAQPDAQDNGGSTVHVSMSGVADFEYVIPSSRNTSHALPYAIVESPTTMRLHLDPRAGAVGTYNIAVWNPGGVPPSYQQKSNTLTNAFQFVTGSCP